MEDFVISSTSWNISLMWTLKELDSVDLKKVSEQQRLQAFADPSTHEWTWITPYGITKTKGFSTINNEFIQTLNVDFEERSCDSVNLGQYYCKARGYDVVIDWDIDWGKIKTYDFVLIGNDPLTDKKILEQFAKSLEPYMIRDTVSPDVYITIAKNSENSVSYSYVPPKIEYVKTGSTTKKVYNWVGQNPRYQTENHYEKIETQGYTKEINHSEMFLEICMLDATRIEHATPPVIYKACVRKSFPNKINILERYLQYAGSFKHPVEHKIIAQRLKFDETIPFALRWGMSAEGHSPGDFNFAEKDKPKKIKMIHRPSIHLVNGIIPSPGDLIINRKYKNHRVHSGEEWNDIEYTYKTIDGKKQKFTLQSATEFYRGSVVPFMRGDYWFRPYLTTIEK